MTYVWSALFGLAFLLSLYPSMITRAMIPLGIILGFGLPFNVWFPDHYLKRQGLPSLAQQKTLVEGHGEPPIRPLKRPGSARFGLGGRGKNADLFDPETMTDRSALIGFDVSGSETFHAYLRIEKGHCNLEQSPSRRADLMIRTPAEVWLGVAPAGRSRASRPIWSESTRLKEISGSLCVWLKFSALLLKSKQTVGKQGPKPRRPRRAWDSSAASAQPRIQTERRET